MRRARWIVGWVFAAAVASAGCAPGASRSAGLDDRTHFSAHTDEARADRLYGAADADQIVLGPFSVEGAAMMVVPTKGSVVETTGFGFSGTALAGVFENGAVGLRAGYTQVPISQASGYIRGIPLEAVAIGRYTFADEGDLRLESYMGVTGGYRFDDSNGSTPSYLIAYDGTPVVGVLIGARYFYADQFYVSGEFGLSVALDSVIKVTSRTTGITTITRTSGDLDSLFLRLSGGFQF